MFYISSFPSFGKEHTRSFCFENQKIVNHGGVFVYIFVISFNPEFTIKPQNKKTCFYICALGMWTV